MVMPKWIAALILALAVAGGFAWLGQWQLGHAITIEDENAPDSEEVRLLADVTAPGTSITDASAGMVFETSGSFVAADFNVIEQRRNGDQTGAWVVGHFATTDAKPGHLAVAIGWAPTAADAEASLTEIDAALSGVPMNIEGRYMPNDATVVPEADADPDILVSMSSAQLVNLWQPFEGATYPGFLVLHPADQADETVLAAAGLDPVDSVPPLPQGAVNWLNVFYAIEWVVFAGFAVFFWYRLARDDWEKIHELKLLTEAEATVAQE